MPRQYTSLPLADRFWALVDRNGPIPSHRPDLGLCWIWAGSRSRSGYGNLTIGSRTDHSRRTVRANRVAYELTYGPLPDGAVAGHHCDNPPCVRPAHLFATTSAGNSSDMVAKERQARGERHGRARLTRACVDQAKDLRNEGTSWRVLAARFGVSPATIRWAVLGRNWKQSSESEV